MSRKGVREKGWGSGPYVDLLPRTREHWEERIYSAAVKACEEHFEGQHVGLTPPCGAALQDAYWWAHALGVES